MKSPATVMRLPVRRRRTLASGERSTRALLVYCPVRRATCALDRCRECDRCEGLSMGEHDLDAVLCRVDDPVRRTHKIMPTAAEVTPLGAVMSREVVCLAAGLDCDEAAAILLERGLSGAPVVDDDGRPLGMLARSDLLRALRELPTAPPIVDVMMPIAYTLDENDALSRGAALMAAEGVHHLPVIGDFGRVVGLISTLDVTRWLARQSGYAV